MRLTGVFLAIIYQLVMSRSKVKTDSICLKLLNGTNWLKIKTNKKWTRLKTFPG